MVQLFRTALTALATAAIVLLAAAPAFATTPQEAIEALVQKMKKTGDLTALVEAVDWDAYFATLTPEEHKALNIRDAAAFKRYYAAKALANGKDRLDILREDILGQPGAAADKIEVAKFASVERALYDQQSQLRKRIWATTFQVTLIERSADTAKITLKKSEGGETTEYTLDMRQVGSDWLVAYGSPFNPMAPANLIAAIGPLPQPEQVLAKW